MLFNSPIFLVFGATFLALWHAMRGGTSRLALLVGASFVFYGWWDWRFTFLLLGSGLVDFVAARVIASRPVGLRRRAMLVLSLVANLGTLATFKYLGFLAGVVASVGGGEVAVPDLLRDIVLPVGISFYTFQSMSYTIDVYRGTVEPARSPLHFFAYLAMFPQLVAGPIERASHILPQLESLPPARREDWWEGWRLVVVGFFKKTVIADNLAPFVGDAMRGGIEPNGLHWWVVAAAFAVQIYCDFSGYTDIARGICRMMGLRLMENFRQPYTARSFRDFWSRWHISLSTWFRDYVYIPLGGSRHGRLRGHVALWTTMLLSGLWHGAGWTFIAWGAVHAAFLSAERAIAGRRGTEGPWIPWPLAQAIVLLGVLPAWILFRADDIGTAGRIIGLMFSPWTFANPFDGWSVPMLALCLGVARILQMTLARRYGPRLELRRLEAWLLPVLAVAAIFLRGPGSAFIYFQF